MEELEKLRIENEKLRSIVAEKNSNSISIAEEKYQTLFTELKDVVYESTPEGKLLNINPSGVELFGYSSKEEILKIDIAEDLYVEPDERLKLIEQIEKVGFVKNYEIKIRDKNGKEIIVLETSFMLKDNEGKVIGYSGIIRDVTESKKQEELLKKYNLELAEVNERLKVSENKFKNLNDEKDKFFSIIAHDLKSPFNALLNLSEFLVEDLSELSLDEIKSFSKEINKAAHSVYNLLLNLLQWAQIRTGRMKRTQEKVALSSLLNNTTILLENVAAKKSIKIINEVDSTTFFYGDRTMIGSVLQNLISNAIKFTKRNGKVIVSSKIEGDKIIVRVSDTGIGISEENIPKLFRLDNHLTTVGTANESGTGLGLILCKELVEKNNGEIWVESEELIGSTFSFSLDKTEV
ncbi:MAG: PAS domain-containing sensor histidine kinase [Melioribacteraceae bacterium]|jgi:PAS domain S-box-containing protein|nr:PAS domain-containing sensor histidine kinase [Melioribacteraceae bacterium]